MSKTQKNAQPELHAKKAYSRPTVTAYGSIVELPKGAGATTTDGAGGFLNADT